MRTLRLVVVGAVWAATLLGVALWAQGGTSVPKAQQEPKILQTGAPLGPVLTGSDLGFQRVVEPPDRSGRIPGRWMVKVNGEWHETMTIPALVR